MLPQASWPSASARPTVASQGRAYVTRRSQLACTLHRSAVNEARLEVTLATGQLQGTLDIHHSVGRYISRKLFIADEYLDSCPCIPLPRNKRLMDELNKDLPNDRALAAVHKGMEDNGICEILRSAIPPGNNEMSAQDIVDALRECYVDKPELKNMWKPARDWLRDLQAKGRLTNVGLVIPD